MINDFSLDRIPISLDLEAKDLSSEIKKALATTTMSMTNNGPSSQIQVGFSNQSEKEIVENITAVYQSLVQDFPGTFANVRSLVLRIGNQDWSVPIYISCGNVNRIFHNENIYDQLFVFIIMCDYSSPRLGDSACCTHCIRAAYGWPHHSGTWLQSCCVS